MSTRGGASKSKVETIEISDTSNAIIIISMPTSLFHITSVRNSDKDVHLR